MSFFPDKVLLAGFAQGHTDTRRPDAIAANLEHIVEADKIDTLLNRLHSRVPMDRGKGGGGDSVQHDTRIHLSQRS